MVTRSRPLTEAQKECKLCSLHESCKYSNKIPARGSSNPDITFIGQNPGKDEDEQGLNFIGESGDLLTTVLEELVGFDLKKCRFDNAVKCWSGRGNPEPSPGQVKACKPFLFEDLQKTKPKLVVVLGGTALRSVTGKAGITRRRGTVWEQDGLTFFATWHPAYILRFVNKYDEWVGDLKKAKTLMETGNTVKREPPDFWISNSFDETMDILGFVETLDESIHHDYETTTESPWMPGSRCIMVSYSWNVNQALIVPLLKWDAPYNEKQKKQIMQRLKQMVEFRNKNGLTFEAYNAVFELTYPTVAHGIPRFLLSYDPYLAQHLIDETVSRPSLKQLAWIYTDKGGYENEVTTHIRENPDCNPDRGGSFDNIPIPILAPYCGYDSTVGKELRLKQEPLLVDQELGLKLLYVLENITLPASYVVSEFESNGIKIDKDFARQLSARYKMEMEQLLEKAKSLPEVQKYERSKKRKAKKEWKEDEDKRLQAGKRARKIPNFSFEYNPASVAQNRELLFDTIGLVPLFKTPKGQARIDKETREILMGEHPLVEIIDTLSHLKKFDGTYCVKWINGTDEYDIYHPYYDLTGTVTGRFRSDFQQLPRVNTSADVKKMLVSRHGSSGLLMNSDISQGEVRMFCICSKDKRLRQIFSEGKDVHTMSASWAWGIPEDEITKELRADIKSMVTFGIMYGRGATALARDMKWTIVNPETDQEEPDINRAQLFIDNYFNIFSGVRDCVELYKDFAQEYGYMENLLGRRRRVPEAQSREEHIKERALRQAVNFPIQSLLHDLMLFGQYQILKIFKDYKMRSLLCAESHDNIIIDVYKSELEQAATIVQGVLENLPFDFIDIPIVVETEIGENLIDVRKYSV